MRAARREGPRERLRVRRRPGARPARRRHRRPRQQHGAHRRDPARRAGAVGRAGRPAAASWPTTGPAAGDG
nr:hypothetical protein [Angustibacter aerolatus]